MQLTGSTHTIDKQCKIQHEMLSLEIDKSEVVGVESVSLTESWDCAKVPFLPEFKKQVCL